jgi:sensor c-di-GMP phosphodiesterase-like protein
MPLIKCHECSGQVSDHARTCPKCGAPVIATIKRRQKQMRVALVVRLSFALVIGIVLWFFLHHLFQQVLAPLQNLQQSHP